MYSIVYAMHVKSFTVREPRRCYMGQIKTLMVRTLPVRIRWQVRIRNLEISARNIYMYRTKHNKTRGQQATLFSFRPRCYRHCSINSSQSRSISMECRLEAPFWWSAWSVGWSLLYQDNHSTDKSAIWSLIPCVSDDDDDNLWGLNMILTITAECSMVLTFTSAKE